MVALNPGRMLVISQGYWSVSSGYGRFHVPLRDSTPAHIAEDTRRHGLLQAPARFRVWGLGFRV
jgi:hypothetical protein